MEMKTQAFVELFGEDPKVNETVTIDRREFQVIRVDDESVAFRETFWMQTPVVSGPVLTWSRESYFDFFEVEPKIDEKITIGCRNLKVISLSNDKVYLEEMKETARRQETSVV